MQPARGTCSRLKQVQITVACPFPRNIVHHSPNHSPGSLLTAHSTQARQSGFDWCFFQPSLFIFNAGNPSRGSTFSIVCFSFAHLLDCLPDSHLTWLDLPPRARTSLPHSKHCDSIFSKHFSYKHTPSAQQWLWQWHRVHFSTTQASTQLPASIRSKYVVPGKRPGQARACASRFKYLVVCPVLNWGRKRYLAPVPTPAGQSLYQAYQPRSRVLNALWACPGTWDTAGGRLLKSQASCLLHFLALAHSVPLSPAAAKYYCCCPCEIKGAGGGVDPPTPHASLLTRTHAHTSVVPPSPPPSPLICLSPASTPGTTTYF